MNGIAAESGLRVSRFGTRSSGPGLYPKRRGEPKFIMSSHLEDRSRFGTRRVLEQGSEPVLRPETEPATGADLQAGGEKTATGPKARREPKGNHHNSAKDGNGGRPLGGGSRSRGLHSSPRGGPGRAGA